jgi:uncharacterized protein YoxC
MLVQICIAVATVALVAVAIALIRVLGQLKATAQQVENTMARLDTTLPQVDRAVEQAQNVLATFNQVSGRVDRIAEQFESVGVRAARLSSLVVDDVLLPASKAAAVVKGVKSGVSALVHSFTSRKSREPNRLEGGNHHE